MNFVFASGVLVPNHLARFEYFRGAAKAFPGAIFPVVPPLETVAHRAESLAEHIDRAFPTGDIHVVAHSMGGLDTRSLLSRDLRGLRSKGRIKSLSTISTPHRGSPIADLLVCGDPGGHDARAIAYRALTAAFATLGIPLTALGNLTSGFTATFNAEHHDVGDVKYFSYAGVGVESLVLKPAVDYIEFVAPTAADRPNDGVVSVTSATWGTFMGPTWAADHFSELGYQLNLPPFHSRFDHIAAIRAVVANATK
jgi:triacylglycerol lipase